jgi:hypothetical protein
MLGRKKKIDPEKQAMYDQIDAMAANIRKMQSENYIPRNRFYKPPTSQPARITPDNSFEYDVFICHSSKDNPIIEALIKDFKMHGITYWVAEEQIKFGHSITQKIEDGLKKSRYIVPCLSKNLNKSNWTKTEYGVILNAEFNGNPERMVIPLKLDGCEMSDIPLLLMDKKRVSYSNKTEFNEFIKFLKEL